MECSIFYIYIQDMLKEFFYRFNVQILFLFTKEIYFNRNGFNSIKKFYYEIFVILVLAVIWNCINKLRPFYYNLKYFTLFVII